jgi:hypothetical protein
MYSCSVSSDHHVVLVVDDALEVTGGHVHEQAEAAGHGLEEPDVADGHGQLDVAHALAAHAGDGHFDAAAVADDALELDPLVLAASALVVTDGAENLLAEEAAGLGLERAVVDRLRVLDLPARPRADRVRAGDGNGNGVEGLILFEAEGLAHFGSVGSHCCVSPSA